MPFVIAALLAWSAFSYGAVYAWAYLPVAAAIVGVGAVVLATARPRLSIGLPAIAALALGAAIAAQTVPVSAALLGQSNHGARKVLSALDVGYANGVTAAHSLSVDTPATWFGLTAFALLAVWLISTSVIFADARRLDLTVRSLVVVGCVLGLVGLAQRATFNGTLLWFWTPRFYATNSFGPFVNRNHFAGWMLLAVALAVGYLFGSLTESRGPKGRSFRDTLLWAGSHDAVTPLMVAAAAVVMLCGVVWTMSRSGIVATGVALSVLFAAAMWQCTATAHRVAVAVSLKLITAGVVAW